MQRILYFAIVLVVFFTFINALVFFGLGIYYSIVAYLDIVYGRWENHPGVILVESLDRFLFGFVFIIFSIGLARLFLPDATFLKSYELPWLKLTDFFQLKTLLISAILVALFVAWAPVAISITQHKEPLDWTMLIFPASLVMLAIAGKFIKELH
jgi:uncharacterized membrane protein YqhA